ncbi:MAG: sugar ABC transporter permease [Defluviitaleaceae bacterium]|nr:sugar ABC transporter permease [Defluviitaleaceae bacterium]
MARTVTAEGIVKKRGRRVTAQQVAPYVFVSPFVVSFLVFLVYPLYQAFLLSFQQLIPFTQYADWVGLDNYRRVVADPMFRIALWNVARYAFWTCVILIPVPMLLAFIVNSKMTRFKNLLRSMYFIPVLTSTVIAGIVFQHMFSSEPTGAFNELLGIFGIAPVRWLMQGNTAMFALVIIAVWRWLGVNMIYFLAGLNNIPTEIYESAEVDGATGLKKFWHITMPMLKPITIFVLTISITAGFSMFNEAFVYWGVMSPNNIGLTIVIMIYRAAFQLNDFGYAATLGVSLFVIVLVANLIQLKFMGLFREE